MSTAKSAYCRLCAAQKPYTKLLDATDDKWEEITAKLIRINANNYYNTNYLSKTVCFWCINSLELANEFVITVENAQTTLRDIFSVQVKEEHVESDVSAIDSSDIKYDNSTMIKSEGVIPKSTNITSQCGQSKDSENGNKKNADPINLDSIPLAHLKLTWKDYNWLCSFCETQFPTIDELREHSMQYHNCCNPYRCMDCNIKKLRLDRFLIHIQKHKKHLRLSCHKCFKQFSTPNNTIRHRKTHKRNKYICLGCNTNFTNITDLTDHSTQYFIKGRARPIPIKYDGLTCPICSKSFNAKSGIYSHMLTHTERIRDHICEVCGKSFLHKKSLESHMMLHNEERPYKCKICKFAFKTEAYLRSHVSVHDSVKPFSCDQCGKCFRLQKQLMSHSIIHTDALPYVCTYCHKEFRFKNILKLHLRQHTGVKPYSCEICNRDFTNWSNYNKHMKRRHDMDMSKRKQLKGNVSN